MDITGTVKNNTIEITLPINNLGVERYADDRRTYYDLGPFVIEIGTALTINGPTTTYNVTPVVRTDAPDSIEYALRHRLKGLCEDLNISLTSKVKPERWSHICGRIDTGVEQHRYAKDITEKYIVEYLNKAHGPRLLPYDAQVEAKKSHLVWILRSPIGTASLPENNEPVMVDKYWFEKLYRPIEAPIVSVLNGLKIGGGLVHPMGKGCPLFEEQELLYRPHSPVTRTEIEQK